MADEPPFLILGSGGHAAVVAELLESLGLGAAGYVGPAAAPLPFALRWAGDDQWLERERPSARLANGIGSTGDPALRARLFEEAAQAGYRFPALVHPSAQVERVAFHHPTTPANVVAMKPTSAACTKILGTTSMAAV